MFTTPTHAPRTNRRALRALAIASAAAGVFAASSQAATITWTGANSATDFNWSDALNWSGSVAPANDLFTDVAHFNLADYSGSPGFQPVVTVAPRSVGGILIDGTNSATALNIGGANTLSIGFSGITMNDSPGAATISAPIVIAAPQTWSNSTASNLAIAGTVTRTAGATLNVVQSSTGLITTTQANDATGIIGPWMTFGTGAATQYATSSAGTIVGYTGGTAVTSADLTIATPNMNSASVNYDLTLTGSTTTLGGPAAANTIRYTSNAQTIATSATNTLTVNGILNAGTGVLSFSAPGTIIGASQELDLNGASAGIQFGTGSTIANNPAGASSIVVNGGTGTSMMALLGANTFTGGVTLNPNSVLSIAGFGSGATPLGTAGQFTINGGVVETGGAFTLPAANTYAFNNDFTVHLFNGGLTLGNATSAVTLGKTVMITMGSNAAGFTVNGNSMNGLTIPGPISDGGKGYGITVVNGPVAGGTVTLSGTETFTGPLTVGTSNPGGDMTYTPRTLTGVETGGSNVITGLRDTTGLVVGQQVTGNGITPPATTNGGGAFITAITPTSVTLSNNISFALSAAATETTSSTIVTTTSTNNIQVGQLVTGTGIPVGTTVVSVQPGVSVTLSNAVTGSGSQTLSYTGGAQAIAFGAVSGSVNLAQGSLFTTPTTAETAGSNVVTTTATTSVVAGQLVTGTGIPLGTTVVSVNPGVSVTLSQIVTSTGNQTLTYYPAWANSNIVLNPSGSLTISSPASLGSGTVTINGGTTNDTATTVSTTPNYILAGNFTISGQTTNFGIGTVTLAPTTGDTVTVTVNANNTTTFGAIAANFSATETTGSTVVTSTASTVGLQIGQMVTGVGIPTGTTVVSFVPNTSVTLSNAVTGTGSQSLFYTAPTSTFNGVGKGLTVLSAPGVVPGTLSLSGFETFTGPLTVGTNNPAGDVTVTQKSLTGTEVIDSNSLAGTTITGLRDTSGLVVGQLVSGTGIVTGTVISAITPTSVTLSAPNTLTTANGQTITNSAFTNATTTGTTAETVGCSVVTTTNTGNVQIGQVVVGVGIPAGTTVTAISPLTSITLSNPVSAAGGGNQTLSYFGGVQSIGFGAVNGVVTLNGSNTGWASNIVISPSGQLNLGSTVGFGNGTVTINGGVLASSGNGITFNAASNPSYVLTNNFTLQGSTEGLGSGTITLSPSTGHNVTIYVNNSSGSNNMHFDGAIVDNGAGNGLTILTAPDTFAFNNGGGAQLGLTGANKNFTGPLVVGTSNAAGDVTYLYKTETGTLVNSGAYGLAFGGTVITGLRDTIGLVVGQSVGTSNNLGVVSGCVITAIGPHSVTISPPIGLISENGRAIIGSAFTFSVSGAATETTGSSVVTTTSTGSIQVGQTVVGTGIPEGTTVTAITANTSITLSNNVTGTGSQTLSYFGGVQSISFGQVNGSVALSGASPSWAGSIVVNPSGTLQYNTGSASVLGTSTVTINGGVVVGGNSPAPTTPSWVLQGSFAMGTPAGNGTTVFGSGNVTLNPTTGHNITITVSTGSGTSINGPISENSAGTGLTVMQMPGLAFGSFSSGGLGLGGTLSFTGPLTIGAPGALTGASGSVSTFTSRSISGVETNDGLNGAGFSGTVITGLSDTTGVVVGQYVYGTGIIANSVVSAVTANSVTIISPTNVVTENGHAVTGTAFSVATTTGTSGETTGCNVVTTTATAALQVGQQVVGTGIPEGTTITAITAGTSITLSNPATATGNQTLSYFGGTQSITFGGVSGYASVGGNNAAWVSTIVLNPGGILAFGSNSLGIGTVTINGGIIGSNGGVTAAAQYLVNADFTIGANRTTNLGTGKMTLQPTSGNTVTIDLGTTFGHEFDGNITDNGAGIGLTVHNLPGITGSFTLLGPLTIGGPLVLNNNTRLNIYANGVLTNYFGSVSITNGGALALGNNGTKVYNRDLVINIDATSSWGVSREGSEMLAGINGAGTNFSGFGSLDHSELYLVGSGNYAYGGALIGQTGATGSGVSVIMAGTGTQTFSGANILFGSSGGGVTAAAGTINEDFSAAGAPQNNIFYNGVFGTPTAPRADQALNLSGGRLTLTGSASQANMQTFSNISAGAGSSHVVLNTNVGSPQGLALLTGNFTMGAGSAVNFVLPAGAPTATNGVLTTASNDASAGGGILAHSTVTNGANTDWAVSNATHQLTYSQVSSTTSGSTTVTVSDSSQLTIGENIVGPNIPAGSLVGLIDDATHVEITNPATGTASNVPLTFYTLGDAATWSQDSGDLIVYFSGAAPASGTPVSFNTLVGSGSGATAGKLYYVATVGGNSFTVAPEPSFTLATLVQASGSGGYLSVDFAANIAAYSAYTTYADVGADTTDTNNYLITSAGAADTLSNNLATNSLKITTSAPGGSLTIAAGKTLTLSSGGLLFTGANDYTITGGSLGTGVNDLVFQQYGTGNLTIASQIVNGNYDNTFTKAGPGTLTLTNTSNNITGVMTLAQGILNFNALSTLGSAANRGALIFNGGTLQYAATGFSGTGDISRRPSTNYGVPAAGIAAGGATIDTNGNNIGYAAPIGEEDANGFFSTGFGANGLPTGGLTKAGLGTLSVAPVNSYAGPTTITGGGTLSVGTVVAQSGLSGNPTAASLTLSGTDTVGLVQGQSITGISGIGGPVTATIASITNTTQVALNVTGGTVATFTPIVQTSQPTIDTSGVGTTLTVATSGLNVGQFISGTGIPTNTYITAIGSGTVTLSAALDGTGAAGTPVTFSANVDATTITGAVVTLADTSFLVPGQAVTGPGILAGTTIASVDSSTQVTLSQAATSGANVSVNFGNDLIGFGSTQVAALANGGQASAIGTSSRAAENLVLDNGTLQYTGTGASTDRDLTVATNGGTLDASGSGALVFAPAADVNTNTIALSGTGTHQLTLTGSSTAANTLGLKLVDQGANASSLVKNGTGVWVLNNGAATYSGGTQVNNGTLLVSNASGSATGSGAVTLGGGILGGGGSIAGTVSGSGTVHPSATLASTATTKLTVGGLTTGSNTTLDFNLVTPNTAGGSDQIAVSGALNISGGGALAFTNHGLGQPSLGYYKIMSYGSLTGTASNLTLPAVANNIAYTLDLNKDPGFVDVHRGFQGDANDDGTVNIVDLGTLATHYNGTGASWSQGDFNGDGVVNIVDLGILATYYNQGVGSFDVASASGSPASGVPEPASLLLLGAGLVGVLSTRRRVRKS